MPKAFSHHDKFAAKAQQLGYRARSAFKLDEILQKFPKLKKDQYVLDLGCAPGSWLQVLRKNKPAKLIGVDLQHVEPLSNVELLQGDIFSEEIHEQLMQKGPFDLITSDMAPKTTGRPDTDQWHSVELNQRVLDLCGSGLLQGGGNLACKIFVGADFQEFWLDFRAHFKQAKCFKPNSCRDRSVETFMIGMGFTPK